MVLAGQLSKSEARTHARKNVITRAIGVEEQVEPEMFSIDLKKTVRFLCVLMVLLICLKMQRY